jgi:3-(methylthio)propanoyl-CoA dehydrogenase
MDKKVNFFEDNVEMDFHLKNRMDFEAMFEWTSQEDRDALSVTTSDEYRSTWIEMLRTMGEVAGTTIAPNARKVEGEDITLKDGEVTLGKTSEENLEVLKGIGLPGLVISPKYGGIGAPFVIEGMAMEMISRACPSTFVNSCWYGLLAPIISSATRNFAPRSSRRSPRAK